MHWEFDQFIEKLMETAKAFYLLTIDAVEGGHIEEFSNVENCVAVMFSTLLDGISELLPMDDELLRLDHKVRQLAIQNALMEQGRNN